MVAIVCASGSEDDKIMLEHGGRLGNSLPVGKATHPPIRPKIDTTPLYSTIVYVWGICYQGGWGGDYGADLIRV